MEQTIIETNGKYDLVGEWLQNNSIRKLLIVAGNSAIGQSVFEYIQNFCADNSISIIRFADYGPNPDYSSVVKGVNIFRTNELDGIVAIGGGSAIDVAKCIKLYSDMPGTGEDGSFLRFEITPDKIPFLVVPSTAGTGSEATRYAVVYYNDEKQSISHDSCIPDTIVLDPMLLNSLSMYQRKATMMDAFSHAIESFWSVNSTEESKRYSKEAIHGILGYYHGYLENDPNGNTAMLKAAFYAGKAINITQTTAGHAMCYKITSLFGCAHGHAAALCNRILFEWVLNNTDKCCDSRGKDYLIATLQELAETLGFKDANRAANYFKSFVDDLYFDVPHPSEAQFEELINSVNPIRLSNFPVKLDKTDIAHLYREILR